MSQVSEYALWMYEIELFARCLDVSEAHMRETMATHDSQLLSMFHDIQSPAAAAVALFVKPDEVLASLCLQAAGFSLIAADDIVYFGQDHLAEQSMQDRQRQLMQRAIIRRAVMDVLRIEGDKGSGAFCISVFDGRDFALVRSRDVNQIMRSIMRTDGDVIIVHRLHAERAATYRGSFALNYGHNGYEVITANGIELDSELAVANALAEALADFH